MDLVCRQIEFFFFLYYASLIDIFGKYTASVAKGAKSSYAARGARLRNGYAVLQEKGGTHKLTGSGDAETLSY